MNGKVLVPKKLLRTNKQRTQPEPPQPIPKPPEKSEEDKQNINEEFTDNLYLCSDIVEESDVGNIKMPVL